ncbi:hypothetical protein [Bordetella sp. FB-8]|uniref:hypothetical protein n=1 Tax=Bordetella sp. FB-8 TaxID=1159870 RepID=UPI000369F7B9|nr:hypothetical protein [Bordetella sp. FB-8]
MTALNHARACRCIECRAHRQRAMAQPDAGARRQGEQTATSDACAGRGFDAHKAFAALAVCRCIR